MYVHTRKMLQGCRGRCKVDISIFSKVQIVNFQLHELRGKYYLCIGNEELSLPSRLNWWRGGLNSADALRTLALSVHRRDLL